MNLHRSVLFLVFVFGAFIDLSSLCCTPQPSRNTVKHIFLKMFLGGDQNRAQPPTRTVTSSFFSCAYIYFPFDKMAESKGASLDLSNAEEVNKAIAMLAMRVSKLEMGAPSVGKLFLLFLQFPTRRDLSSAANRFIRAMLSSFCAW